MTPRNLIYWRIRLFVILLLLLFLSNEFVVYFIVLLQCRWPSLPVSGTQNGDTLRVMILADVHLLGSREGHWFDKLRREWQMERSFQTSMLVHKPDVVFILGDLFDEGKWCSDLEFQHHVERFGRKFATPSETQLYVVAGNHDMGFHYMIDDRKRQRFSKHFSSSLVHSIVIRDNIFVLINSMAFEGDGCSMCKEAEVQLRDVQGSLLCAQGAMMSCPDQTFKYSNPVLLQHFPLFRESDQHCDGPDSAPDDEKFIRMKPKWDCLDKGASQQLLSILKPRLVLSGHTHHSCLTYHNSTPEWNVPSFSWRYKKLPSFLMMSINPISHEISKCYLPHEVTVIYAYLVGIFLVFLVVFFPRKLFIFWKKSKSR